jgi:hypothetical protein
MLPLKFLNKSATQHLNGLRVPRWLSRLQRPHAGPPHGSARSSGAACLPGVAAAIASLARATSHRCIDDYRIIDEARWLPGAGDEPKTNQHPASPFGVVMSCSFTLTTVGYTGTPGLSRVQQPWRCDFLLVETETPL